MANPVAAHTFGFERVYLSQRDDASPGGGTWSSGATLFDGTIDPTHFFTAQTFSAGALGPTDANNGIICATEPSAGGFALLAFLGNGQPTAPIAVAYAGQPAQILSSDYWDTTQGAWAAGGAFYIALNGIALGNNNVVVIIRSTNAGVTWALQDEAGSPSPASGNGINAAVQRVNNKICVFTLSTGTTFAIWEFDLTTNTWGAEFADLSIPNWVDFTPQDSWTNGLFKFPNGDYLVLYDDSVLGPVCRLWNGTVWAAPQVLPGGSIANAVIDPSFALVYILTYAIVGNKNSAVHCSTFTHAGSAITPDLAIIPAIVGSNTDGVGHCSIQNNKIFVPRDDFADFANAVWVAALPITAFFKELLPVPAGETNAIKTLQITPNGSGYVVNDTGTIDGGAAGFLTTYKVTAVTTNAINAYAFSLGTGYVVGDTGHLNAGGSDAFYEILAVNMSGSPTSLILTARGSGYPIAAGITTTADTGVGTGLLFAVVSRFNGVSNLVITNGEEGGGYSLGVHTTTNGGAQPGIGTGLEVNIIALTGKTPSCAYMMFPNGYVLPNPLPPGPPPPIFPPSPPPFNNPQGGVLIYPVNYRELDTAAQIAAAPPIRTSYTGRLIATDHTRKWTRWNVPAVGAALMYRVPGKLEPIFYFGGNVYALRADLLTDDDLGLIVPYYTTYFFVTHDAEMGLMYQDASGERQPLGSGRKLLAYLKAYIAAQNAQAPGTCQIVITPFVDNLQNPLVLIGLRTLVNKPKFDVEWPGGQAQGDRIALQFWSTPITGTDNGFSLQRLTAFLKRAQRLQIRGAN